MALSEIDRSLLQRCLARKPRAWEDFVDRFMGLLIHVVNHTAGSRSRRLNPEDREDLVGQVLLQIVRDDFALLRRFRGESSLATYLTVISRRIVVHELLRRPAPARLMNEAEQELTASDDGPQRITDREEVERLLEDLNPAEAEVVRLYHLAGRSYAEISAATGIAENTIGPLLSRARRQMRLRGADRAAS